MHVKKTLLAALLLATTVLPARAQTQAIDTLPVSAIFVVSSGMWEDRNLEPVKGPDGQLRPPPASPTRGYYKVIAIRQGDGTAKIYLQRIVFTADGPSLLENIELEEFSQMKSYVTDVRPESSNGASASPGLFVTVYLKTDPMAKEADSWTILIDELGEMKVEKASN
ncbi:hypothetical protein EN41_18435 [Agrobacterium tumefaciens]|jgi:hypothetical protein|uniref:Uncharacterized protein n=1 Tax=Agrobacterium fabrum (strain C58 / ATCC 33970) TaxID=176299 RepID=A9CJ75_AGRFC|nr:hypothetical protein [Agrobacterium fabrum]KEY55729.1 hypothetical protein EN41_18435 [Agrobacterium tumefaciens]AAK87136.1 hypothetical protein Atu1344 [Agrobacterium fabrum str. C58]KJX88539.1 hypothetical protein SY94_1240 [Agrobacterium tumefaciens]MCX2873830.1 hypothetical protein [Agrobacterium fabrum]NMV67990.1 hypothetical protein [Agrobacterium fabrum]